MDVDVASAKQPEASWQDRRRAGKGHRHNRPSALDGRAKRAIPELHQVSGRACSLGKQDQRRAAFKRVEHGSRATDSRIDRSPVDDEVVTTPKHEPDKWP